MQFIFESDAKNMLQEKKYFQALRLFHQEKIEKGRSDEQINAHLSPLNLQLSHLNIKKLEKEGSEVFFNNERMLRIFNYKNKRYVLILPPPKFNFKTKPSFGFNSIPSPPEDSFFKPKEEDVLFKKILFIDNNHPEELRYLWLIVIVLIDTLLLWFYIFLRNKIKPLNLLKDNIIKFSKGNLNINTQIKGKDEISQVSNEFNIAITKIRELTESRNLFLRNIMHELKTPITKGKIISDTLLESRRKEILQKVFYRLEFLLEEFSKIEELTSGKTNLELKEYRIIDLIDQALDLLLIDSNKIDIKNSDLILNVDFKLFTIALKNLIDNALKYNKGDKPIIYVMNNCIYVKNESNKLTKSFGEYLRPFSREYESIDKGLGLGLYITNSIVNIHQFKLDYEHKDGFNTFTIHF